MFSPMNGTGSPDLSSLTGSGSQPSMLDRATTMLAAKPGVTQQENERIRTDNPRHPEENRTDADADARRLPEPPARRPAAERASPVGPPRRAGGPATGTAARRPRTGRSATVLVPCP